MILITEHPRLVQKHQYIKSFTGLNKIIKLIVEVPILGEPYKLYCLLIISNILSECIQL